MTSNNFSSKKKDQCSSKHVPCYLRLDSVGEVSSSGVGHKKSNIREPDKPNYSNLIENFNMGSIFDTASNCLNTYLSKICPYKSGNGLCNRPGESKSLRYFGSLFGKPSGQSDIGTQMEMSGCSYFNPDVNWAKPKSNMSENTQINGPVHWPGNIFGALNCNISPVGKQCGEKYIPPQKRCYDADQLSIFNPSLTPYNAKLLENSKRLHFNEKNQRPYTPAQKKCKFWRNAGLDDRSINSKANCDNGSMLCEVVGNTLAHALSMEENSHKVRQTPTMKTANNVSSAVGADSSKSGTTQLRNDVNETDWFEYECQSVECIPMSEEKLHAATLGCTLADEKSSIYQDDQPQVLSWTGFENDSHSQNSHLSTMCNNSSQLGVEFKSEHDISGVSEKVSEKSTKGVERTENSSDIVLQETKGQDKNACTESNLVSVLYIRNIDKKKNCSAKKRRRRKAQQEDSSVCKERVSSKDSNSTKSPIPMHADSTIAFILGYDPSDCDIDLHSFQISCDINSESDWTESDCESDEIFSSIEDESILANELGFQCGDLFNGMSMCCTAPSSEPVTTSSNTSALDAINLSWQTHMATGTESRKKTMQQKQVHFAQDKELSTVHPIIAWSYAYQAARKGPWEEYARDRGRFLRRITDSEQLLSSVLQEIHRSRIYDERFSEHALKNMGQ